MDTFYFSCAIVLCFLYNITPGLSKDDPTPCDINSRHTSCHAGHCCVRDDFLYTETYCKPYGKIGSSCVLRQSFFECPCHEGLHCTSNINGHIDSVFGKCQPDPGYTSTSSMVGETTEYPNSDATTPDVMNTHGYTDGAATDMLTNEQTTDDNNGQTTASQGQ